jgi:hypothetical protein
MSYLNRKSLAFFYLLSLTLWLILMRHFPFMEEFFSQKLTRWGLDAIIAGYLVIVMKLFWGREDDRTKE